MARYNKGANAERELIHSFSKVGFAVLRVAGSGVSPLPSPDVVAIKGGRILAIECKAWKGEYLAIPRTTMLDEVNWAKVAGAEFFVGWKVPREGWLFVRFNDFHDAGKNFMISLKEARVKSVSFDDLVK
ncbi:MAG: Holliday junction resolvase Hjc [Candidatus Iainarchaeum sp.]|jgi:Holliday junction resolvase|nr:MAG: Archaeal holliday junction resolvase (hjc) [archaeon ADurb.Bin336]